MTERENLGIEGVCGDREEARADLWRSSEVTSDNVGGVSGKLELPAVDEGEAALEARWAGRKMPARGIEVVKYFVLSDVSAGVVLA